MGGTQIWLKTFLLCSLLWRPLPDRVADVHAALDAGAHEPSAHEQAALRWAMVGHLRDPGGVFVR